MMKAKILFILLCSLMLFALESRAHEKSWPQQTDSLTRNQKKQEKQDDKKTKATNNGQDQKPEIATVPKARKQLRPTVVKPKVSVKPIKVIKPKIKKP